jgi:hypothetical protein
MTQSPIPRVKVESVEVDRAADRLKSLVAVVDYRPGLARIELRASCDVPFAAVGDESAARLELHRLIDALAKWANATSQFDPTAPSNIRAHPAG